MRSRFPDCITLRSQSMFLQLRTQHTPQWQHLRLSLATDLISTSEKAASNKKARFCGLASPTLSSRSLYEPRVAESCDKAVALKVKHTTHTHWVKSSLEPQLVGCRCGVCCSIWHGWSLFMLFSSSFGDMIAFVIHGSSLESPLLLIQGSWQWCGITGEEAASEMLASAHPSACHHLMIHCTCCGVLGTSNRCDDPAIFIGEMLCIAPCNWLVTCLYLVFLEVTACLLQWCSCKDDGSVVSIMKCMIV